MMNYNSLLTIKRSKVMLLHLSLHFVSFAARSYIYSFDDDRHMYDLAEQEATLKWQFIIEN